MNALKLLIILILAGVYSKFAHGIGADRDLNTALITAKQITTPPNPSSGFSRIYVKADGKAYILASDGTEKPLGSGAGGNVLNLLADGSFEDDVSAVTCSSCTATQETSVVLLAPFNLSSLRAAFTASTGSFFDDELTGSQYTGVQGKLSLWLKTDQSGVVVYPRCDGAGITGLSVDVASDNKWHLYEIPFVMCGTSNGYQVEATASITGNIYADDIFLGASDPTTNIGIDTPAASYTPTTQGLGTITVQHCLWERQGPRLFVDCKWVNGTTSAVEAQLGLPSGLTISSSYSSGETQDVGSWIYDGTSSSNGGRVLATAGDTFVNFSPNQTYGGSANNATTPQIGTEIGGSSTEVTASFSVLIEGWSASESIANANTGSNVRLDTANGYGSTNTVIRNLTNDTINAGSNAICQNSATLGASCTIAKPGFVIAQYCDRFDRANNFGISINSSTLTTDFSSLTINERFAQASTSADNRAQCAVGIGYLQAGAVLRPHVDAGAVTASVNSATFSVLSFSDLIIGMFKDVVTSPGSSNGKPVLCSADYNTSNVEQNDYCNYIASATGSPVRTFTFESGFWAEAPNCWCDSEHGSSNASSCEVSIVTTATAQARAYNAGALSTAAITIFCHGVKL